MSIELTPWAGKWGSREVTGSICLNLKKNYRHWDPASARKELRLERAAASRIGRPAAPNLKQLFSLFFGFLELYL